MRAILFYYHGLLRTYKLLNYLIENGADKPKGYCEPDSTD